MVPTENSSLPFTKMEGLGNDFVVIDNRENRLSEQNLGALAKEICDRHFGIGADGLILVEKGTHTDYQMRIFNPDGSEPEQCGNGLRCFAKYVFEHDVNKKDMFSVSTKGGTVLPAVFTKDGKVVSIEVDMGEPRFAISGKEKMVREPIEVVGQSFEMTYVSMGNPHCVIFVDDLDSIPITNVGPIIENSPMFPDKTNVHFAKINNPKEIVVKTWERGAGETLACGTGACATLVAAHLTGKSERKAMIHLPGGELLIEWSEEDNHVTMAGPARVVFEGEYWPN